MMHREKFVFAVLLVTSLTTTAAYSQGPTQTTQTTLSPTTTPTREITPIIQEQPKDVNQRLRRLEQDRDQEQDVMKDLRGYDLNADSPLWTAIGWMFLSGAIGGFIFELLSLQGNIELPHGPTEDELAAKFAYATPKNVYDLGFLSRCIIGGLAAPPTMLFLRPESYFALLAMSVVAGSAGTALFRALQDRVLLAISQKNMIETEKQVKKENANAKLEQAFKTFEQLEREVRKVSVRPQKDQEESVLFFAAGTELDLKAFENLEEILSNSKGANAKVDIAIRALDQLWEQVRKVTTREKNATKLMFPYDATLPLKYFDDIRKCLSEAKGINENIVTAENVRASIRATQNVASGNNPTQSVNNQAANPQTRSSQNGG